MFPLPCVGWSAVLALFVITIKKCPLEFTQTMSTKIHPQNLPIWKKVSSRCHCLWDVYGKYHTMKSCIFDSQYIYSVEWLCKKKEEKLKENLVWILGKVRCKCNTAQFELSSFMKEQLFFPVHLGFHEIFHHFLCIYILLATNVLFTKHGLNFWIQ